MRSTGYLEYAAANNIIMLFPQNGDQYSEPYPYCWEASITPSKNHPQIQAIGNMIKTIFNRDLLNKGVDPNIKHLAKLNTS